MPESFLGDGLIFEESLPVVLTPGPLAEGVILARLNADNHQLLGAESSLDEVRVHEALKDESPALLHELQRLEYKVNILLRLTAELSLRSSGLPQPERVRMSSRALEWFGEHAVPARSPDCCRSTSTRRCRSRSRFRASPPASDRHRWRARNTVAFRRIERRGGRHAREAHLSTSSTLGCRRKTRRRVDPRSPSRDKHRSRICGKPLRPLRGFANCFSLKFIS